MGIIFGNGSLRSDDVECSLEMKKLKPILIVLAVISASIAVYQFLTLRITGGILSIVYAAIFAAGAFVNFKKFKA